MMIWFGAVTIVMAIIAYGLYVTDMIKGKTKPHSLTWLIWGILNSFIFYQQVINDAGPGAWVTGVAAVANFLIVILSFRYGDLKITRLDWFSLFAVIIVFIYWRQTADETIAVVLASLIFAIGFVPTIRKAWHGANEETLSTYVLNSTKFLVALFALEAVTVTTALYPALLFVMNAAFVVYLLKRRKSYVRVNHK